MQKLLQRGARFLNVSQFCRWSIVSRVKCRSHTQQKHNLRMRAMLLHGKTWKVLGRHTSVTNVSVNPVCILVFGLTLLDLLITDKLWKKLQVFLKVAATVKDSGARKLKKKLLLNSTILKNDNFTLLFCKERIWNVRWCIIASRAILLFIKPLFCNVLVAVF